MQTASEAARVGLGTAWSRISHNGGVDAMARRIEVPMRSARPRSRAEMMAAFVQVALAQPDRRLTTEAVRQVLGSGGGRLGPAVRRHRGRASRTG